MKKRRKSKIYYARYSNECVRYNVRNYEPAGRAIFFKTIISSLSNRRRFGGVCATEKTRGRSGPQNPCRPAVRAQCRKGATRATVGVTRWKAESGGNGEKKYK